MISYALIERHLNLHTYSMVQWFGSDDPETRPFKSLHRKIVPPEPGHPFEVVFLEDHVFATDCYVQSPMSIVVPGTFPLSLGIMSGVRITYGDAGLVFGLVPTTTRERVEAFAASAVRSQANWRGTIWRYLVAATSESAAEQLLMLGNFFTECDF